MFGKIASIVFSYTCTSNDPQKTVPHVKIAPLYLHENILNILPQYCRVVIQVQNKCFKVSSCHWQLTQRRSSTCPFKWKPFSSKSPNIEHFPCFLCDTTKPDENWFYLNRYEHVQICIWTWRNSSRTYFSTFSNSFRLYLEMWHSCYPSIKCVFPYNLTFHFSSIAYALECIISHFPWSMAQKRFISSMVWGNLDFKVFESFPFFQESHYCIQCMVYPH